MNTFKQYIVEKKKPVSTKYVAKVIIYDPKTTVRAGMVLMVQGSAKHKKGRWELPGGHIDMDKKGNIEHANVAGARELQEELGITVSPDMLRKVCCTSGNTTIFFILWNKGWAITPAPNEIMDVQWYTAEQMLKLLEAGGFTKKAGKAREAILAVIQAADAMAAVDHKSIEGMTDEPHETV